MLISNNYHLGQLGSAFILWNTIELIYLTSKNLQTARKAWDEEQEYLFKKRNNMHGKTGGD